MFNRYLTYIYIIQYNPTKSKRNEIKKKNKMGTNLIAPIDCICTLPC